MKRTFVFLLFFAAITTGLKAQPGTLDASFNGKGIKPLSFVPNISSDTIAASVVQPDGKMVVVVRGGTSASVTRYESSVIRLNTDGSYDNTFGLGGRTALVAILGGFFPTNMVLRNDGRILICGAQNNGSSTSPCIVGLNADGTKDELFGDVISGTQRCGYKVVDGSGSYYNYSFQTMQIDPATDYILASGCMNYEQGYDFLLVSLDRYGEYVGTMFNGEGYDYVQTFGLADANKHIVSSSVFHTSSRTLYIAGTVSDESAVTKRFAVLAFNFKTGQLQQTFAYDSITGRRGMLVIPLSSAKQLNQCTALAFSPDSLSLFIAGYSQKGKNVPDVLDVDFMVCKVSRLGKLDNKFALDGIATYRYPSSVQNYANSFAVQSNGKMMIGGSISTGNSFASVMRINSDSTVDNSFGSNGYMIYNQSSEFINSFLGVNHLHALKSSTKYILLGCYQSGSAYDAYAKRINNDGSNDNSYGTSSKVNLWSFGDNTSTEDAALRADGNIWVCGNTQLNGPAVALLKSDGSLSNTGIINLSSYFPATSMLSPQVTAITLYLGKPVLAGTYSNASGVQDIFIMQLKLDGTPDSTFGTNGITKMSLTGGNHYVHDLVVQDTKGILLYGYMNNAPVLVRFGFNGIRDMTFAGGTGKVQPTAQTVSDAENQKISITVSGNKIYGVAVYPITWTQIKVFVTDASGILDTSFASGGIYTGDFISIKNSTPTSLAVKSTGEILVGGYVSGTKDNDYAILQLTAKGIPDTTFNSTGVWTQDYGLTENIIGVYIDASGNIVAAGGFLNGSDVYQTAFRLTAKGKPDKTLNGTGYILLNLGFPRNTFTDGNALFFIGYSNKLNSTSTYWGQVTKMKLGTGTVVKTASIHFTDINTTYGVDPFPLTPSTTSPAPIYYTVVQSSCAEVGLTTGKVKITCATIDDGFPITIRAYQPAVDGYTAATATVNITVAKAYPRVYFPTQGGVTGTKFKLQAYSQSSLEDPNRAQPYYYQNSGYSYFYYNSSTDSIEANAEGQGEIEVNFNETKNYLYAYKTAVIYIYDTPIAPVANDDQAQIDFGQAYNVEIDVLDNDEAYSGTIVTKYPDLDPSTPGIDSVFVSPSLGLFEADSNGVVTYTPFTGFIGSGEITYAIMDSKGLKSQPATIKVAVVSKTATPALKATEMITPNNDGLNEAFVIGFVDLEKENVLRIFDRNGEELFSQNNYQNDWKGELSNGKQAENGVYYYVFVEGSGDSQRELKGALEIRR